MAETKAVKLNKAERSLYDELKSNLEIYCIEEDASVKTLVKHGLAVWHPGPGKYGHGRLKLPRND